MNERVLRELFQNCSDVVFRPIIVHGEIKMLLVYVDGLVDTKVLDQVVLKPMMFEGMPDGLENVASVAQIVQEQLIALAQIKTVHKVSEVVGGVLKSNLAILTDGDGAALLADLKGFEKRSVEEPVAEISLRGPRDGFTETLRVNTTLVRRRIRSPKLKMESLTVGNLSQTDVVIAYIEGIVQTSVLDEVRKRVQRIQMDSVLESGYIEEFIEDQPFSPFPTVQHTERPDVVCASILEGKVAIFVDNTPFVLIVPFTFWSGLQAAEDYYERSVYTTFVRFLRLILLNVALFFPSLFVAATTFHPQLIPTSLLISIAAAREGVPFPAVIEALLMEFMFEGLREAGIRLPRAVGSAVSIVGALVIGQAAVQAGIISAPIVIVVATTGIASFAIPRYNLGIAYRMLRFPLLLMAGTMGLYGIAFATLIIFIHLVNLRSFGIPYLTPVAPQIPGNLKDVFWRAPRWSMTHRPALISGGYKKRVPEGQKPSPNSGKNDR
ncbi:spore germination protein [Alicyclobacillus fastidiosus]|uniref:Spore germination protein n=2 Tax=Alicyclobacillus fastidiosus TaxID=392011 RepID=A0ABY6ZNS6_9BACL|nr:spore germination protein [Alicyclobacillus fastidiosus]WAH44640.1 spore germination protein [Alicyclobacillus fastidiosus]